MVGLSPSYVPIKMYEYLMFSKLQKQIYANEKNKPSKHPPYSYICLYLLYEKFGLKI